MAAMRTLGLCMLLAAAISDQPQTLKLGDREVILHVHHAGSGPLLVNLHDDENTAVDAGLEIIGKRGGTLLELRHTGARLIPFELAGKRYAVDPNRIFTPAGIPATLRKNGPSSPAAIEAVRAFADALLHELRPPDGMPLIALHNNTRELSYSIQSYQPGGSEAGEAEEVAIGSGADPNDFFLVTERSHFAALAARGFNVVLQKARPASDDGSLSVFCAQKQIPYVNVEAEHGHRKEQVRMLEVLYDLLAATR